MEEKNPHIYGRVLLVDDCDRILKSMKLFLMHYECVCASSGRAAAQLLAEQEFDVVVTDFEMDNGDGQELTQLIHDKYPGLPIIVVSGRLDTLSTIAFANGRVFRILQKPIDPEVLCSSVFLAYHERRDYLKNQKLQLVGATTGQILHDINNNLSLIDMGSQLCEKIVDPTVKKFAAINHRAASKIKEVISRYKSMMHSPATLRLKEYGLLGWLHELLDNEIQALTKAQGVTLTVDIQIPENHVVALDQTLVIQAFLNLISNACEATQNSPTKEVKIEAYVVGHQAKILISDSGPDIPQEVAQKLFKESVSTKGNKGTGLGLTYAYQVFLGHLGTLELKSNQPTCFAVTLSTVTT